MARRAGAVCEGLEDRRLLSSVTTLLAFSGGAQGQYPVGTVALDPAGNLWGSTGQEIYNFNLSNPGVVFEVSAGTHQLSTAYTYASGASVPGGLYIDSAGNVYGADTFFANSGSLFEIDATTHAVTTLALFNGNNELYQPTGDLIADSAGNLYGSADEGGTYSHGGVFEYVKASGTVTMLASFSSPIDTPSGLVEDAEGNLYGTTLQGGANGFGEVFEVAAGSGTVTTLASFDGNDGYGVHSRLVIDGAGNLFGASGQNLTTAGAGDVFEVDAATHTLTVIHNFQGSDGSYPVGELTMDSAGDIFGSTWFGKSENGEVYELAAGTRAFSVFAADVGAPYADGGLAIDGSGDLFGTTNQGGPNNAGTVYEVSAASSIAGVAGSTVTATGSSASTPIHKGDAVTLSATVSGLAGTPTGTVTFLDNGIEVGGAVTLDGNGTASISTTALLLGSNTITANYSGDGIYAANGGTATVTVAPGTAVTAATLSISPATTLANQTYTETATVTGTSGGPTPTGTVTFYNGTQAIGTSSLDLNGQVVNTTSTGENGPISFVYNGDSIYAASSSNVVQQTVFGASSIDTTVVKTTVPANAVEGQKINARVMAAFKNTGSLLKGKYVLSLYLQAASTGLGSGEMPLTTAKRTISLKAGKSFSFTFALKSIPAGLAPGEYTVVAQLIDPLGDGSFRTASYVNVESAYVTLSASARTVVPATIKPGKAGTVNVLLGDQGTIPAAGKYTFTVGLSNDGVNVLPGTVVTSSRHGVIKVGGILVVKVRLVVPKKFASGTYEPMVTVTLGGIGVSAVGDSFEVE